MADLIVLADMHTLQISLPWHPLIAAAFLFLVGFVVLRLIIRLWDLVGF